MRPLLRLLWNAAQWNFLEKFPRAEKRGAIGGTSAQIVDSVGMPQGANGGRNA